MVDCVVMPDSGFVVMRCPACTGLHAVHYAKIVFAPCGASYRLRVVGTASPEEQRELRGALAATHGLNLV
jgi:hypothetical protein